MMTSTILTHPSDSPARQLNVSEDRPVFPPGRYGRRRGPRRVARWVPVVGLVLLLAGTLWLTERLYRQYGDPYQPHVTGLEQLTDSSVTVVWTVQKPDTKRVTCRLKASNASGLEVGYTEVGIQGPGTLHTKIATSARASTVDVLGCRAS